MISTITHARSQLQQWLQIPWFRILVNAGGAALLWGSWAAIVHRHYDLHTQTTAALTQAFISAFFTLIGATVLEAIFARSPIAIRVPVQIEPAGEPNRVFLRGIESFESSRDKAPGEQGARRRPLPLRAQVLVLIREHLPTREHVTRRRPAVLVIPALISSHCLPTTPNEYCNTQRRSYRRWVRLRGRISLEVPPLCLSPCTKRRVRAIETPGDQQRDARAEQA